MRPSELTFLHTPRITEANFRSILVSASSPAASEGAVCYTTCIQASIDPAIALAFFNHESTYGTKGLAVTTKNWGNIRRSQGRGVDKIVPKKGPFAHYTTWQASLADWCDLIKGPIYIGDGRTTVDKVLDKYAPPEDHNDPESYAAIVTSLVTLWSGATIYRVMAQPSLIVRSLPGPKGKIVGRVPKGMLISGALVLGECITGYDDPVTPEPARVTNGWVQLGIGYVSLAWLQEVKA